MDMPISSRQSAIVTVRSCEWASTMATSHNVNTRQRRVKPYEINMCAMIAFHWIGPGYKSIQEFCKLMNMPPLWTVKFIGNHFPGCIGHIPKLVKILWRMLQSKLLELQMILGYKMLQQASMAPGSYADTLR